MLPLLLVSLRAIRSKLQRSFRLRSTTRSLPSPLFVILRPLRPQLIDSLGFGQVNGSLILHCTSVFGKYEPNCNEVPQPSASIDSTTLVAPSMNPPLPYTAPTQAQPSATADLTALVVPAVSQPPTPTVLAARQLRLRPTILLVSLRFTFPAVTQKSAAANTKARVVPAVYKSSFITVLAARQLRLLLPAQFMCP